MEFKLTSSYRPAGDQPQAIEKLTTGVNNGFKHQTLLGVTGSGKTFTVANVIDNTGKPTLVISHNKTLAAQLYQEFREFFPKNAVCYFVSYYDYYQPEAYMPATDTYIEKETEVNEEIDKLRLATTTALATRNDVIVVASVSAIYNIGSPHEYQNARLLLEKGQKWVRSELLSEFARLQYERNDIDFTRGTYRVRGENIEILPAYENRGLRLSFKEDLLTKLEAIHPITGKTVDNFDSFALYPAKHYVASEKSTKKAIETIKVELEERLKVFTAQGKHLEAHRLRERTNYDIEMINTIGYCKGIENYSRHFDGRLPGEPPYSLLGHFPKDFLLVIDESHMTIPQIQGMYRGDRARKEMLVDFGFRLPSAYDNRPLKFEEFARKINQAIYTSATPAAYEISISNQTVEQLVRPTGLMDPQISIRKSAGQIENLIAEIDKRANKKQRVLVTTLTKRMAEELTDYLKEKNLRVQYLHSDVQTLDRSDILDDLRLGNYDVLVGINLLREGLDLPEVSLVAILDADKEGFLRSETSLIQTMGRAARHIEGKVILYADNITGSMQRAMAEVERRRKIQLAYNKKHAITPQSIEKPIREKLIEREKVYGEEKRIFADQILAKTLERARAGDILPEDKTKLIKVLTREMKDAARVLDFERAAVLRDQLLELKL
ncbi:excinuclease ABC subunit B [Candidatus Curtissbacteria bacterium RIFCSPHIGHO2_02_FULL_40_17]|uniref:UvrABC system protein B n=3 Tax=Candidatus Curtissiibacteriota TaxID=1752717 RepID=A0A1F5GGU1_9BACT|nr:MAG: excinuclease ABC subunit B [Candidatus Curtissbacteria bacterium RIFCSPHIGHO2_02_FULL_40_17]OGE05493.1 MAG: excinuclease ABC subunit B [Candidatus Curtissbacteria bacterium RIFCSPHIGHO2_12_FULL_41_17]OGE07105.1 MAG: excinuclease ABC subunit B [Candidatus Curtissbacteria bacterium RIFCSPLOWO2_02_FULL_40_13b]